MTNKSMIFPLRCMPSSILFAFHLALSLVFCERHGMPCDLIFDERLLLKLKLFTLKNLRFAKTF